MAKGGWTYIVTDRPFGILYVGVTADLAERITAHREGRGSAFCRRWSLKRLVLAEPHDSIENAIVREKALKNWKRDWKLRLIAEINPTWDDLYDRING
ncbi:GIY-YIG nuclease family protein [Sphingomonas crocodyli]|uniref:GIY-YIG nuclease family protein n=1 Tax=Sphingomonas crocodyli TaxID=1979270 RepID=A0A437M8Z8_9SPHN|nr:GIY-YIG nuclease family protein [Sphingomonas crocodyli]RVT93974.1 GIY-YIG nuclease family protein [Sphingomonas crocodyli]